MTEPILTYKKGEGWVYDNGLVKELGLWRLTLYKRDPEPGETFVHNNWDTPELWFTQIKGHWNWNSKNLGKVLPLTYEKLAGRKERYPNDYFFTIKMEMK